MQLFFVLKCLFESSKRPSADAVLRVDPAVPADLRRKPSSQESQTATRNTEPIVNSSETLSLDPFHRCRFRTGWSHCALQRRIPIGRITSSRGTVSRALSSGRLVTRLTASRSLTPFQRPRSWVFHASDELYLRGE